MENPNTSRFRYCPSCGTPELESCSVKSFLCSGCGFKFYINCASAVMALIFDDQDRLLVTRRKYAPGKGTLDLPGGFAEPGEGIEQSLIREIKEELNLEVIHMKYEGSFPNHYEFESVVYPITDMVFRCGVETFAPLTADDDVEDVMFLPVFRLDPDAFGMASARKAVLHLQGNWVSTADFKK